MGVIRRFSLSGESMFAVDRRVKLVTLFTMCFALFMAMLDNTVVNVALPTIQRDFGSGVSGLQWIISAYTLFFASLMLTGGALGDLYGRKRLFLIGLVVFSGGSLLCGLAPTLHWLVAGRALQGVGAAALLPGTLSILITTFPDPQERAQAIGIWAGISGLALAAGPVLGGVLVETLGWQSVFFINVPIGFIAFLVALRTVRESSNRDGRSLDLLGQGLAIVSLGTLVYALIEANNYGWTSPLILSLFAVGAVAMLIFLYVEAHAASPMLQLKFFRNPTFAAGSTVAGLISFGMFGIFFFLTLYWQNIQGFSALQMGLRVLPLTAAIIVTAPLAGQVAGRIGSRWPMTLGMAIAGTGILLLERITPTTPYGELWWNMLMLGVGMGMVMAPMTAAVTSTVPRARAGMASGTTNATREVGGVFGIALLGAIVTHWFSRDLAGALAGFPLPQAAKSQIVALASHGGGTTAASMPASIDPALLHRTIDNSFVYGIHVALGVSAAALLFGAVLSAVFVGRGSLAQEEPAAPPLVAEAQPISGVAPAEGRAS
jgi:MFS transporter, DHA2 family, methylenomycin A resistance protein